MENQSIELKNFIKKTLLDVAFAVREANEELVSAGKYKYHVFTLRKNTNVSESKIPGVQFDIGITAAGAQKDSGGFMVALATLGAGAKTDKENSHELVHRIKFEVGMNADYV